MPSNPMIGDQGEPKTLYHPVLGFRGWEIYRPRDGSPTRLRSPSITACIWNKPEAKARCMEWGSSGRQKFWHRSPHENCGCGYYGYYDPLSRYVQGPIHGAIAAHGKVQVHTDGFRAERVRILALALPLPIADMPPEELEAQENMIREIAAFYRVPAVEPADLLPFAEEHATHVPKELRPEPKPRTEEPSPVAPVSITPNLATALASLTATAIVALLGLRRRRA